jgi:hypothetical protein
MNCVFFVSPSMYYCDIFVGLFIVNYRAFRMNILEVLSNIFCRASHCDFSWYLVGCLVVYFVDIFGSLTMLLSRFCLTYHCELRRYIIGISWWKILYFFELFAVQYLHKFRMINCKICRYFLYESMWLIIIFLRAFGCETYLYFSGVSRWIHSINYQTTTMIYLDAFQVLTR